MKRTLGISNKLYPEYSLPNFDQNVCYFKMHSEIRHFKEKKMLRINELRLIAH